MVKKDTIFSIPGKRHYRVVKMDLSMPDFEVTLNTVAAHGFRVVHLASDGTAIFERVGL